MSTAPPDRAQPLSDRPRPATLDVVGFVLAIVIPLAGLVVSLVAVRGAHRRSQRAPGLTVAAVAIAAVLLVLQIAGGIGGAFFVGHLVATADDPEECAAIAKYPDLLASDGPASLDGLTQQAWDKQQSSIGTWHSEMLELVFALPDQSPSSTDEFTVSVNALADQLDPETGWKGKDWSAVSRDVDRIRGWRDAHCR